MCARLINYAGLNLPTVETCLTELTRASHCGYGAEQIALPCHSPQKCTTCEIMAASPRYDGTTEAYGTLYSLTFVSQYSQWGGNVDMAVVQSVTVSTMPCLGPF